MREILIWSGMNDNAYMMTCNRSDHLPVGFENDGRCVSFCL
jgi:hypothetical protein